MHQGDERWISVFLFSERYRGVGWRGEIEEKTRSAEREG